jgi:hypothetical protein
MPPLTVVAIPCVKWQPMSVAQPSGAAESVPRKRFHRENALPFSLSWAKEISLLQLTRFCYALAYLTWQGPNI